MSPVLHKGNTKRKVSDTVPPASLRKTPSSIPVKEQPHLAVDFAEMILTPEALKKVLDRAIVSGTGLRVTVRPQGGNQFEPLANPWALYELLSEGQVYAAQVRYQLGGADHLETLIVTRYGVRHVHVAASP